MIVRFLGHRKNTIKIHDKPCDNMFTFENRIDDGRERKYFGLMMQHFSEIK